MLVEEGKFINKDNLIEKGKIVKMSKLINRVSWQKVYVGRKG